MYILYLSLGLMYPILNEYKKMDNISYTNLIPCLVKHRIE